MGPALLRGEGLRPEESTPVGTSTNATLAQCALQASLLTVGTVSTEHMT